MPGKNPSDESVLVLLPELELELEGPPPPDIDSHDDYLAALADMVDAGDLKKEPRMG